MSRTAILYVTERCNQACVFCLEEDGLQLRPDVAATQVAADLAGLRANGAEHLTFMGGETFLRKDLPSLLSEARRLGFTRLGVTTNGTALANPGFLERMIDAGLEFVEISVHADEAQLAAEISGKSFTWERQQRALAELETVRDRIHVIVNLVICHENRDRVERILRTLLDAHPRLRPTVKLKLVSMIGAAASGPSLRYDAVDLGPAFALLRERNVDYWTYNLPLCRVPGEARHSHEAQAFVLSWRYHDYDHRARDGYYDSGFQLEGNVWPAPCDGCTLSAICPGLEETYRRHQGDAELHALSDDPRPIVAGILSDAHDDPARADAILAELSARPRPRAFVPTLQPKPGEAALAFAHPSWPEPLCVELTPANPRAPGFAATDRLRLSYRKSARDPGRDLAGQALLDGLTAALTAASDAKESLAAAAARLAQVSPTGWSCAQLKLGPAPPRTDVPLAIRVPQAR